MKHHSLISAACLSFATAACGVPGAAELETVPTQTQALEAETSLPDEVEDKVRSRYRDLTKSGALDDRNWKVNTPPPELTYTEILLQDDYADKGVTDGYYVTALIPTNDPQGVHRFFVNRVGGVSGWQFLAGPFPIDDASDVEGEGASEANAATKVATVVINEQNAFGTVSVPRGATLVAELPANASTGYTWLVSNSAALGTPAEQYVTDQPSTPGASGTDRFIWSSVVPNGQPGQTFQVRCVYKRSWEAQALRDFTITLVLE